MSVGTEVVSEAAGAIGLIPLAFVAWTRPIESRWWILAGAFAVSWVIDATAHIVSPWYLSLVYPIAQCGAIGAALLPRRGLWAFLLVLVVAGCLAALQRPDVDGPDVILHTVAWLGVCVLAMGVQGLLRWSLVATFGLGWFAWIGYLVSPGWASWGVLQSSRLLGALLFCAAVLHPHPVRARSVG